MGFDLNISLESPEFNTDDNDEEENLGERSLEKKDDENSLTPIAIEIEKRLKVGSFVENLDQVYVLYCEYARLKGFSVKKGSQNYFHKSDEIRMKVYHCSSEGHTDNKRSLGRLAAYKKRVTRTNCKARLRVVREIDGPWMICKFYKEHNHELLPPDQSYLLRSAHNMSYAKKSILEALNAAGIKVSSACRYMEKESGGHQNVGFIRKDAYAHMSRLKKETKVENGDANALVQFFIDKSNKETFFYWNVQLDDEGRVMNFFFRDSCCVIDYDYFGDVLSIDSTYRTNKYNLICVPFVGINHHCNNVLFGLAFLSDETTKSFEWLFGTFLESVYGKEPQIIFSDQCQALMNGVDYTFRTANHRLCQWHINQNAPSHFGSLNCNSAFKKAWHYCMNGCETESEFEQCWKNLMDTYNLRENRWFNNMYNLRRRWSSVFTNDRFSTGLHATSRSEVTNKVLKDLCSSSASLYEFVMQYQQIQKDWRTRESAEDAMCLSLPGQYVDYNGVLKDSAKVLTCNVFKKFEREAVYSINVGIVQHLMDYSANELEFHVYDSMSARERIVLFNNKTHHASCSCRMWECEGVLCCHIFNVLFSMNMHRLPESYILRRWRKDVKQRLLDFKPREAHQNKSDLVEDMVFVNYVMRVVYDMAQNSRNDPRCRSIIKERISAICNKLSSMGGASNIQNKTTQSKQQMNVPEMKFRNPPNVKTRGFEKARQQSHWGKKRGRGSRGTKGVVSNRKASGGRVTGRGRGDTNLNYTFSFDYNEQWESTERGWVYSEPTNTSSNPISFPMEP